MDLCRERNALRATGGGRVTELLARPLVNLLWPELAGIVQPLSGDRSAKHLTAAQPLKLAALPSDPSEESAYGDGDPAPEEPKPDAGQPWRVSLKVRLERAQKVAHERKATAHEPNARKALAKLQVATDEDQSELEFQTSLLERKLGEPQR